MDAKKVRDAIGEHFNYDVTFEVVDILEPIIEAVLESDDLESDDLGAIIFEEMGNALIYYNDIWKLKKFYEGSPKLEDETIDEIYNDIYSIVEKLKSDNKKEA